MTKTCKKCKKNLSITSFSVREEAKDGYRNICKPCINERFKQRKAADSELLENVRRQGLINTKRWRKNNPDRYKLTQKKWATVHREQIRTRQRDYTSKKRARNREFIDNYLLQHPCIDCGNTDIRILEFDHVRGIKKDGVKVLSGRSQSLDTIKTEISKCEVRCPNCHTLRHWKEKHAVLCS
jgi:hypothetical protein